MIISISPSQALKLIKIAGEYLEAERFIECQLAEDELEFQFKGEYIGRVHRWLSGIGVTTYEDHNGHRLTNLFDNNLQLITRIDTPSDTVSKIHLGSTMGVLVGYLIKYSSRRRLTLGETRRIRKEHALSKSKHVPSHHIGDIINYSTPAEPTGRTTAPHERCAHFRKLKSGKTIRVKSCIIHKDRFEGSQLKRLTGV